MLRDTGNKGAMNNEHTIFVVDDSAENRDAVRDMLLAAGYMVECACNGREALDMCANMAPKADLFVIDIAMPVMGGLDMLKELRVFENTYEAIIMTGDESLASAKTAMEGGAFCYISKPLRYEELIEQVHKALHMVEMKKQRIEQLALLEIKVQSRTEELESMVRLLEYQGSQLDAIVNSLGEGVVAIDNQQSIVLLNRRAEQIFGVAFAECAGRAFSDVAAPLQSGKRLLSLIEGNDPAPENAVLPVVRKGGETKFYLVNIHAIGDESGACAGKVIVFLDLTESLKAERLRNAFLSIVAHELRTPINISMNYLALLKFKGGTSGFMNEAIGDMQTANSRLAHLVNRIVSLASLSDSGFVGSRSLTDIGQVVATEMELLRPEAEERQVHITIENRLGSIRILSDPHLLKIAISNLLSNAIKFNKNNGLVRIALEKCDMAGRRGLLITFSDEGCGISESVRATIFESFIQGEASLTRKYQGMGIGLYLAKRAVNLLGGIIGVESGQSCGSCFTVQLPVTEQVTN